MRLNDRRLAALAPGTLMETHGVWIGRLAALARSLQACAGAALLVVAAVAVSVIAVATRAGLAARREAIEIVHGLGATDGYIAARFAARATVLAAAGALAGGLAALPVLVGLARLSAPFAAATPGDGAALNALAVLPSGLWLALPTLPLAAAAIGLLTAQATVRRWLRRLP
jgi:cell division transport system permease protein